MERKIIKNSNKLSCGSCTCLIKDKYSGKTRYAEGYVSVNNYKSLYPKDKKNVVFVIHNNNEKIIGYYQNRKQIRRRFN